MLKNTLPRETQFFSSLSGRLKASPAPRGTSQDISSRPPNVHASRQAPMRSPSTNANQDLADPFRRGLTAGSPPGVNARTRRSGLRALLGLALSALLWGGCSSSDPTVDPNSQQQGCDADADCPAATPFCNAGACFECRGNLDCTANEQCAAGACGDGPPCGAGCGEGVCNAQADQCVECLGSDDCDGKAVCRDQHCMPRCDSSADCDIGVCDTLVGACVACLGPSDCPSGQYCQDQRCEPQACAPNESRCEGNAVRHCNATGSAWAAPIACGENQTCVEESGHAYCDVQRCTPGEVSCDQERVVKCSNDGLKLEVAEDCPASGEACEAGACVPVTCTPGETFCLGNEFRSCRLDGSSSDLIQSCTSDQHCDDSASCLLNVCSPGESTCVGNTLHVCESDGSAYDGGTPCGANAECVSGVCETHACTPDAYFCDGGNVQRCSPDGLSWNLADYCEPGGSCVDGDAACHPSPHYFCTPNEWECAGTLRRKCNATGNGYTDQVYCPSGQECVGADCRPVVCSPNHMFCKDGNSYQCNTDGSEYVIRRVCAENEYCSTNWGDCRSDVCTANTTSCSGNYQRTCNAEGSAYANVYCPGTGQICLNDQCQTVACTPLSSRCADALDAEVCRSDGSGWDPSACGDGRHCSQGKCVFDSCAKGEVQCNGTSIATCKADGSGFESGGVDCAAAGQTCVFGECRDMACTPGSLFCQAEDIYQCDPTGRVAQIVTTCDFPGAHCEDGQSVCVPNVCAPGEPSCDGDRATTCNANGSGYAPSGVVCPVTCAGGSCATSLFSEDFEGAFASWSQTNNDVMASQGATGADSSAHSLVLTRTGAATGEALGATFPTAKPSSISWWARVGASSTDYSSIQFIGQAGTNPLIRHGFFAIGSGVRHQWGGLDGSSSYLADTWYHFELRNIDWTTWRFDYFVDGTLRATNVHMDRSDYGISSITLDCGPGQTTCAFDQIELTP